MSNYQERYIAGEHEAVWNELVALGPEVRQEEHYEEARAVARETMLRVRHNVDMLFPRLQELGYDFRTNRQVLEGIGNNIENPFAVSQIGRDIAISSALESVAGIHTGMPGLPVRPIFRRMQDHFANMQPRLDELKAKLWTGAGPKAPWEYRNVFDPPKADTPKELDWLEEQLAGPLPISLRAWYEIVGGVSFLGTHEALDGNNECDPLVVAPVYAVVQRLEDEDDEGRAEGGMVLTLAPNFKGGAPYAMRVPDSTADAILLNERHDAKFVPYLRRAFKWGGFPGLESQTSKPEKELAFLREGLLPF